MTLIYYYEKITLNDLNSTLFWINFWRIWMIASMIDEITRLKHYEFKKKNR